MIKKIIKRQKKLMMQYIELDCLANYKVLRTFGTFGKKLNNITELKKYLERGKIPKKYYSYCAKLIVTYATKNREYMKPLLRQLYGYIDE